MSLEARILQGYAYAHDVFAQWGLDIDKAIEESLRVHISMHCWQGDDFHGLEGGGELTGGIAVTGNAPGCPRNVEELRADIEKALSMIPGETKLNLHANYAQTNGRKRDRDAYTIEDFEDWVAFAKEHRLGLDFNPTFFSS